MGGQVRSAEVDRLEGALGRRVRAHPLGDSGDVGGGALLPRPVPRGQACAEDIVSSQASPVSVTAQRLWEPRALERSPFFSNDSS